MKFYYVALTINKKQPVKTDGGKRLAYYLKEHQAIKQKDLLNERWEKYKKDGINADRIYKVYCVESEPMEVE